MKFFMRYFKMRFLGLEAAICDEWNDHSHVTELVNLNFIENLMKDLS